MAYDEWGIHLKSDSLTVNATSDDSNTGIQLGFVMLVGQALQQRYDVEIMGGDCKASVVPEEVVMSLPVQSDVSATSGGFVSEYKQMKTTFEMDPTKITGSNLWVDTSTNMDNTQGNATFCARTLLYYDNNTPNDTTDDVLVSFFNAVFLLDVDLSGKSFVLTAATEALENEDAGSTTIENEYQVQACFCIEGYDCIDDQDSVALVQNSEVHICLKPESADTEIATFWMEMNQESNPSDLLPLEIVADGEGLLLTSIESDPSDDVIKITSRLLGTFFLLDLSPLPAITVTGRADLVFKSSGGLRHLAQDVQNSTQGSRKAQGHTFGHSVINARRATESDGTPANSNAAFEMTINIARASDDVDANNDDEDAAHPDEKVNIKSGQAESAAFTLSKGLSLTVAAALFVAIQG
uniref:Uncharacterized protein n=1 Tax=Trieres chinensis TaxID=1514140 RepID=A0A7S2A827_TRICV